MRVKTLTLGSFYTNCFIAANNRGEALVIDPGFEPETVAASLAAERLTPTAILLTHAHADHLGAVPALTERYGIPVWLHADDLPLYRSRANAFPPWLPVVEGLPSPVAVLPPAPAGLDCEVIHTPGHTPGSVCFYFAAAARLFGGDTLFLRSVGRTDLPGGDAARLADSIRAQLFCLPAEVVVLPGHGPETSIGAERAGNPFVRA